MAANEEKERHIEELRRTMKKYRRVEEMIATSQGRKGKGSVQLHGVADGSISYLTNLLSVWMCHVGYIMAKSARNVNISTV